TVDGLGGRRKLDELGLKGAEAGGRHRNPVALLPAASRTCTCRDVIRQIQDLASAGEYRDGRLGTVPLCVTRVPVLVFGPSRGAQIGPADSGAGGRLSRRLKFRHTLGAEQPERATTVDLDALEEFGPPCTTVLRRVTRTRTREHERDLVRERALRRARREH